MVHREGGPLAEQVSSGECNVESAGNDDAQRPYNTNYMVHDKVPTLCHSVAELENTDENVVGHIAGGDSNEVQHRLLRFHRALLAREDALGWVVASMKTTIVGEGGGNERV